MATDIEIAFFGSSLLSTYWNGAATYYRGIIRALHALGHRITFFEPDAYGRQDHRDLSAIPDWADVRIYRSDGQDVYRALLSARDAAWIIKASGVGVHDELLELEVLANRRGRTRVAFWDVDAPATLDRVKNNPSDPFRTLIPQYDVIFTYGGGQPVVRAYSAFGAKVCVPVYNALDPETHHPVSPDPAWSADLFFLGNRLPDRESRVQEFFIGPAERMPHLKFALAGSGWESKNLPGNIAYLGHAGADRHNILNCSARAVLNVSRNSMAAYGFSPATRVFEAAGAGACIISDSWDGMEMFFEPDKEILVAQNGEDVCRILHALSTARARAIGDAARQRALRDHTYDRRALEVHHLLSAEFSAVAGDRL